MQYSACMQYTLRNIPPELDSVLRSAAKEEDKSLNQVAIDALMRAFGLRKAATPRRNIDFLVGSWDADPDVEKALEEQRKIDPELWT